MASRGLSAWIERAWRVGSHLGVNTLAIETSPAVVATNQFVLLVSLVNLPYLAFFLAYPGGDLLVPGAAHAILLAVWACALVANARGAHLLAAFIALSAPVAELGFLTAFFGADAGFQLLLVMGAAVSFTMLSTSPAAYSNAALVAISAATVALWLRYADGPHWQPVASPELVRGMLVANLLLALLGVFSIVRFSHHYFMRERRRNQQLLEVAQVAAQTDALTSLPNRRGVAPLLSSVARRGAYVLALVDLDRFKLVNDRLGHGAGDVVLANVAHTLADAVGESGTVARWGGEEFLIVLPGAADAEARALLEAVRSAVEREHGSPTAAVSVTASIGYACAPRYAGKDEVLRIADRHLYAAKSSGRNLVIGGAMDQVGAP